MVVTFSETIHAESPSEFVLHTLMYTEPETVAVNEVTGEPDTALGVDGSHEVPSVEYCHLIPVEMVDGFSSVTATLVEPWMADVVMAVGADGVMVTVTTLDAAPTLYMYAAHTLNW